MELLHKLSIRGKLLAIIILTSAVALGAGFSLMLATNIAVAKRDLVENNAAVAKVTGAQCVTDLAFGDPEEAGKTLEILGSMPDVQAAFLFDDKGELFSTYQRNESSPIDHPSASGSRSRFVGETLLIVEPISYQGDEYGALHLAISTNRMRSRIRGYAAKLLLLLIVLLAGAALLAWRLEKLVSVPILELARVARDISRRHDYSVRVEKRSDDEIGALTDDLNEMLEQIERRQRERDEADQRTREKSQFLANMSHELRTPLNAIIGFSEILETRLADRASDREQKFIENIHTSGQHLLGIVNDILDLSKIEAGRMEIRPERMMIETAIDGVCALMRGVSGRKNISFDLQLEPALPEITADASKMKQVLYNLLSNAVKFSHTDSSVTIRARSLDASTSPLHERAIQIDVIDHGIGIDPKHHDSIFREFQQVDATISRQFEGTGLGLALVGKFVDMHAGRIELESKLGEGSTFTIILPVAFRGLVLHATPMETPIDPMKFLVLVIEDEEPAFNSVRDTLSGSEFQAIHASSGEAGLEYLERIEPAVILLDLVLPGIGGFDVLRELKSSERTRDIPVIVVSKIESNRELGLVLGVDDYMTKPVDAQKLLSALRRLFGTHASDSHILVIDDDPNFHDLINAHLSGESIRVTHALDGRNGLREAIAIHPTLIVLDLLMQDMDGFDVAVHLRANEATARIPILVATAHDLTSDERQRLKGKINALVGKQDLDQNRILSLVRGLVPRRGDSRREEARNERR